MSAEFESSRRSRREAAAWYDRLSRWHGPLVDPFERSVARRTVDVLAPRSGERILEIGPGTGRTLVASARATGETGRVVGVDAAAGMCRESRNRVRRAAVDGRVTVVRGDATRLPLRDGSVDAASMTFVLELFTDDDASRVLDECKRVLGNDGRLCVAALSNRERTPMRTTYERLRIRFPRALDCRPIPVGGRLVDAGFRVERTVPLSLYGLPVDVVLAKPR